MSNISKEKLRKLLEDAMDFSISGEGNFLDHQSRRDEYINSQLDDMADGKGEGRQWIKGDVFITTFWGVPEVCLIQSINQTEVFFIRLESIRGFKKIKKDYCAAGLRMKIFNKINKKLLHHSDWYTEYRTDDQSPAAIDKGSIPT